MEMSQETQEWLNTQTLIGFTEKRGNAWHYQESLQGDEPNHYEGPVPVEDVERRLFDWEAIEIPYTYEFNGVTKTTDRKSVLRSDTGDLLGVFKDGYMPHQYREWLLRNVATLLDDDLGIGSAGLLKNGAQAWVSVEVPENITTPEGVEFRPNLVAATSFDGSLATTYGRVVTNIVCDNTLQAGLSEKDQKFRLKHTRYSPLKIADARDALAIVFETADVFAAEVARLTAITVSDEEWKKVLDLMNPIPEKEGRGRTVREHKRDELLRLYTNDDRVAPWAGTAFGVLAAFNTYEHHYAGTKGRSKVQRNRDAALTGSIADKDAEVLKTLMAVAA